MEDIKTHLADNGKRFIAYLIDALPIMLVVFGIFYLFFGFDETLDRYFNRGDDIQPRIDFLRQRNWIRDISFLTWIAYCVFMESSARQGTWGKSAMGIIVVDASGNRITLSRSFARNINKLLSLLVFSLGFIWILFDKNKQGWHDKLSKTYVVEKEFNTHHQSIQPIEQIPPIPGSPV